jgi:hypothetical protein
MRDPQRAPVQQGRTLPVPARLITAGVPAVSQVIELARVQLKDDRLAVPFGATVSLDMFPPQSPPPPPASPVTMIAEWGIAGTQHFRAEFDALNGLVLNFSGSFLRISARNDASLNPATMGGSLSASAQVAATIGIGPHVRTSRPTKTVLIAPNPVGVNIPLYDTPVPIADTILLVKGASSGLTAALSPLLPDWVASIFVHRVDTVTGLPGAARIRFFKSPVPALIDVLDLPVGVRQLAPMDIPAGVDAIFIDNLAPNPQRLLPRFDLTL